MVQCDLCGAIAARETAIDRGWAPWHWDGDEERGPVCLAPTCRAKIRFNSEHSDFELVTS